MIKRTRPSIGSIAAAVLIAFTVAGGIFGHTEIPTLAFLLPSALVTTFFGCIATGVVLIVTFRTRWRASRLVLAGIFLCGALIAVLLLLVMHFTDDSQVIRTPHYFGYWVLQLWQLILGASTLAYAALLIRIERGAVPNRRTISAVVWTSVVVLPILTIAVAWELGVSTIGIVVVHLISIAIAVELIIATGVVAWVNGDRIERAYGLTILAISLAYLLDYASDRLTIAQYVQMALYTVASLAVLAAAVSELLSAYEKLDRTQEDLAHQLERIHREADIDALSDLPNRAAFRMAAMQALREAGRGNESSALAIIDLDRFNEINATYGHAVGDQVIAAVGAGLHSRLRPGEIAGRIGGDTFGVLLAAITEDAALIARLAAVLGLFAETLAEGNGGELIRIKANTGVAAYPHDAQTYDDLIARAETALQVAKRGNGGIAHYHAELEGDLEARRTMRRMLADGIEANQLMVYYQPSISLIDGRPAGAEALVRWRHPTRGLVDPDDFIPFAEQHGLIGGIGSWVLQRVAADITALRERLGTSRIFINLSLNQVDDITLAAQVGTLIDQYPGLAERIGFEITESAAMRDTGQTIRTLSAIRRFGIPFALDDFGTGYSALAHLKRLPIDVIKIDRMFVAGIPGDEHDAALIETQVAIARQFGYDTHAEGVEREDQMRWLRNVGCRFAQGFLIARPMPFEEYVAWLAERPV